MSRFYPAGRNACCLLFCLFFSVPVCAQRLAHRVSQASVDYARQQVYPALVNITVVMRYFDAGRAQRAPAGGSGVIVSPEGYVLTNYHVAGNTTRIMCTLPSGESIEAKVVCHDPPTDLSVLKLLKEKRANRSSPLPYAALGDSEALQVGETVIAVGNPLMLSSSLTVGVVSNPHRVFTDFTGTQMEDMELEPDEKTGMFTRWIQHDALILPGNSGGPLVNLRGEVVGINELGGGGVGFAIPSNTAAHVLRQAIRYGRVQRGSLGIGIMPVGKLGRQTGALIASVTPGSPAEKAKLMPGDILLSIDDRPVNVRFFEQVPPVYQRIAELPIGTSAHVRFLRGGQPQAATLTVERMPPFASTEEEFRKSGLTVRNITQSMALAHNLPVREGVWVTGVRPGYPFDRAKTPIRDGDIIVAIDGKPTPNTAAFRKAITSLAKSQVPVTFRRKDESLVTVVDVTPESSGAEGGELSKAWMGVKTQVLLPEIAQALNMPDAKGFRVTEVYPGTQASKAGLQVGDVITALNGNKLEASRAQDSDDLRRAVEDLNVGEKAALTVLRGGASKTISVPLEEAPSTSEQAKKVTQDELEFTVRDISTLDRMDRRLPQSLKGVLVVDAPRGGWANMAGLHIDDILLSIHGKPVTDTSTFERVMKEVMKRRPRVIDILVRREYRTHFVFIEPDWSKLAASK